MDGQRVVKTEYKTKIAILLSHRRSVLTTYSKVRCVFGVFTEKNNATRFSDAASVKVGLRMNFKKYLKLYFIQQKINYKIFLIRL